MFFNLSLRIMSSERNFSEFEGGQHTNLILGRNFQSCKLLLTMEMEAKDLSFFDEEMQPHHFHMFDRKYPEVTKYLVQNVETNVEP